MVGIIRPAAAFIIGLLSTACLALPTADEETTTPAQTANLLQERENFNTCGGSSFTNTLGPNSPLVSDCQALANSMTGGQYILSNGNNVELARKGTCAFYTGSTATGILGYRVGNTDIRDLVRDSINKFQAGGKVSAFGIMPCQSSVGTTSVFWTIRS